MVRSRLRCRSVPGSEPDSTEDPSCMGACCMLNLTYWPNVLPQVWSGMFDRECRLRCRPHHHQCSKLQGPAQNSPRVASKWDVNVAKLNNIKMVLMMLYMPVIHKHKQNIKRTSILKRHEKILTYMSFYITSRNPHAKFEENRTKRLPVIAYLTNLRTGEMLNVVETDNFDLSTITFTVANSPEDGKIILTK
ncbi:hypothetical protein AVEN_161844-1 [Araneus ventricosus]|uniref:Uncharacterized protein n=1 Tax=Araneus ventricosus TaxID=182803 RepID=A0A4Y2IK32_ARAVE|nr:hypothetical protein AVEN_161844-1 [Araneus ventricosus]